MINRKKELLKSTFLVLGAFAFAYNASSTLHELGHAIAYWITGGTVRYIIIHPFSWSYCMPSSASAYPNFTTWGGVVFGTLMGLLLVIIVWRWRGPYVILAFMTGTVACLHNGFYLIFSCLAKSKGDATSLLLGGTPKVVVIMVGLLMFGIGIVLAGMCMHLIGIRSGDGVKSRILVLGGGLLPYLVATLLYQWLYNAEELGMWIIKGVGIAVLVLIFGVLSAIAQRRVRRLRYAEAKRVTWPGVLIANLGAFVILTVIFISLRSYKPETTTRYRLGYYDRESNFAGINLKITYNPTAPYEKSYQSESVVFWNWLGREGKREFSDLLAYFATVCPQTLELIVEAMDGVLAVPMNGGPHRWVFKQDYLLLHSRWAVSKDRCKMLVYGMDPNLREYVLIALDILNGRTTKFEIPDTPWEMIFIDETTAIASVGEDLIKVEFAEGGVNKSSLCSGTAKKGKVEAVYKGEFVFHSPVFWTKENADQHTIEWDNIEVPFADPVQYVYASKSYIWAIDIKGQIFRINSKGSKLGVGTYDPNNMIGRGTFDDSFWTAFLDGTVRVFGDSIETVSIELP
ncbi:MAG: zinc metalloprotease [Planctomycetota bacterium]|jgi:hypothetical protein